MLVFSTFIVALAVTMLLIPVLMRYADRLSVIDLPNERKVHTGAIPRVGGIAMLIGAVFPMILWLPGDTVYVSLLLALCILLFFGTWDDSRDLDYRLKFLGQFAAVALVIFVGDVKLSVLPFTGFDPLPDAVSVPLTFLFLVGVTNAVNLSDGLDGLAAGVMLLSLFAIALLAHNANGGQVILICFAVTGAVFGFLRFNTYPAQIFMGDTGSQFLGFLTGVLAVIITQQTNQALNPTLPLFLLGLPIIDMLYVMIRRIRKGVSPFVADKTHIHHQLLALGMAHYEAVSVIYLTQIAFILVGVFLRYESDLVVVSSYLALSLFVLGALALASKQQWQFSGKTLTRTIAAFDDNAFLRQLPIQLIQCGVVFYLVAGSWASVTIGRDIGISAGVIFLILSVRLLWANRLRFVPLRLLVFPTIAFAVYVIHGNIGVEDWLPFELKIAILVVLVLLMLLAVRFAKQGVFQTTPTDMLVIVLAAAVGVLYQQGMIDADLAPVLVGIVVLFYAAEMVLRQMQHHFNCFTLGMLGVLGILASKLF